MNLKRSALIALFTITLCIPITITAQINNTTGLSIERRPFDFSNDYYDANGVNPRAILARRNGSDNYSVFDRTEDKNYRNVRITGISPAFDYDGRIQFVAHLGLLAKSGFKDDETGEEALSLAHRFPVFAFPSTTVRRAERQPQLIPSQNDKMNEDLVVFAIVDVEFTEKAFSKSGAPMVKKILGRNGATLDGTYVIRSLDEIDALTRRGLVTQLLRDIENPDVPGYVLFNIFEDPRFGGISPDSWLDSTKGANGEPLASEREFINEFGCLQVFGDWCGS